MNKLQKEIRFEDACVKLHGHSVINNIVIEINCFVLFNENKAILGSFTVNGGYDRVDMDEFTKAKVKQQLGAWMIELEQQARRAGVARIETHPESDRAGGLWARYGFSYDDDYTMSYAVA